MLADLGSASERHARIRERDARLRSERMHREHTETPHGVFPPPCPKSDEGVTPLRRLELYYEQLWALGEEAAICENCREKDVGTGVGDGAIGSADEKFARSVEISQAQDTGRTASTWTFDPRPSRGRVARLQTTPTPRAALVISGQHYERSMVSCFRSRRL